MSTHEREQFFGAGMGLGILLGFLLGSLLAARIGEGFVAVTNHLVNRLMDRHDRPNFELLLQ